MTAKELIGQLSALPQEATVILSIDEEGNGFSPLCDVSEGVIDSHGEFVSHPHDIHGREINAVCLWP